MPQRWSSSCLAVLGLLLAGGGQGEASEPYATFTVKNGWVEFSLRKSGEPVADAAIEILDAKGEKFGEGETGADGRASFPLPPGDTFIVEIRAGKRTADPIRLTRSAGGVEPGRVLLSYGLRPCCRMIRSGRSTVMVEDATEAPATSMEWDWWLVGEGALF